MTAVHCSGADTALRAQIVATARGWIGTPYVHQASHKGAGSDCLGLVRGVWRETYGAEPELPPGYTASWSEVTGRELLLEAAARHLVPVPQSVPGDLLIFRMRDRGPAKHAAILATQGRIIHAYSGHAVCESALTPDWAKRLAGQFRFPAIEDIK